MTDKKTASDSDDDARIYPCVLGMSRRRRQIRTTGANKARRNKLRDGSLLDDGSKQPETPWSGAHEESVITNAGLFRLPTFLICIGVRTFFAQGGIEVLASNTIL